MNLSVVKGTPSPCLICRACGCYVHPHILKFCILPPLKYQTRSECTLPYARSLSESVPLRKHSDIHGVMLSLFSAKRIAESFSVITPPSGRVQSYPCDGLGDDDDGNPSLWELCLLLSSLTSAFFSFFFFLAMNHTIPGNIL